jgi:hypothetical protein
MTDGIESAIAQAKAAAGDKDVTIVGAASIARQCLQAGLADELHIDIMPLLLGGGLRLFEDIGMQSVLLERIKTVELPGGRTHLRFRFVKENSDHQSGSGSTPARIPSPTGDSRSSSTSSSPRLIGPLISRDLPARWIVSKSASSSSGAGP